MTHFHYIGNKYLSIQLLLVFGFALSFLLLAGSAHAATYYVSPTGSNTAPYDTWAKAAILPNTIVSLNPASGPHVVLIAPGTYASYINISNANWLNSTFYGVSAAGVANNCNASNYTNYPPADGEIVITAVAGFHALSSSIAGLYVNYMEFSGTDSTHDTLNYTGSSLIGRHVRFRNSGRNLINFSGTGLDLMFFLAEGAGGVNGLVTSGAGAGTLSYGKITNSTTILLGTNDALYFNSSGNVTLNNIVARGNVGIGTDGTPYSLVKQSGAGNTIFNNSTLYAGTKGYIARQYAGSLTLNNCNNVPATRGNLNNCFSGTVARNNSVETGLIGITTRPRTGYISPNIDDSASYSMATDIAAELKSRGMKGTWYMSAVDLTNPPILASALAMVADGTMEIGSHGYTHSDLSLTGNIFTITKAGNTFTIDRAANKITLSGGGEVDGFKAKSLDTIRAELTALSCTLGDLNPHQSGYALGEIMADVTGAASGTAPQYLIDATGTTGLFKSEITDAKTIMETALGTTINSFGAPWGVTNANIIAVVRSAGYTSLRQSANFGNYNQLSSIDLYSLYFLGNLANVTDAEVTLRSRYTAEVAGGLGTLLPILNHPSEMTIAQWRLMLNEFAKYPEITVTSMGDAVNTIKTSGTWTTADNRTYTRTWTDQSDYNLLPTSPNIDAGTNVSLATDYTGTNPIYGTPDIGAYEYQPPHNLAVATPDTIDIGAGARIYADGKFRDLGTTTSVSAHLKITPQSGSFAVYDATTTRPTWLDVTNIANWSSSHKTWTESNAQSSDMITDHTIGDLNTNKYYTITVTDASSSNITGINGTTCSTVDGNAVCQSNSSGTLSFQYDGGYSTHTFDITALATADTPANLQSTVNNQDSITVSVSTFSNDTLGSAGYLFTNTTANHTSGWITTNIWQDTGLTCGNDYTYTIKYRNANLVETTPTQMVARTAKCPDQHKSVGRGSDPEPNPMTNIAPSSVKTVQKQFQNIYLKKPNAKETSYWATKFLSFNQSVAKLIKSMKTEFSLTLKKKTTPTSISVTAAKPITPQFTQNISPGQSGLADIKALQQYLNAHGFQVANRGPGSTGKENNIFGPLTQQALKRFQEAHSEQILKPTGLTKGTGFFGPSTRDFINSSNGR